MIEDLMITEVICYTQRLSVMFLQRFASVSSVTDVLSRKMDFGKHKFF